MVICNSGPSTSSVCTREVSFRAGSGMKLGKVKISVVIPAFNEEKLIGATLRSIQAAGAAFGERGWAMEIVVCDNNSTDATADLARAAGPRVVFEPVNQ